FAFSLPAINREGPASRYEWTVLPQGMKNSPTSCQMYVDAALKPVRTQWPKTIIYHYMDDILVTQPDPITPQHELLLTNQLKQYGLIVAPEKVQRTPLWKYLGWSITEAQIKPQKLTIQTNIKTLQDAQKLTGDLQWLRPVVGISNEDLEILRPLLRGTDPSLPVQPTSEQIDTIQHIS
ncbi:Putative Pol polyprotein, partial [Corvus brachyrhynchos]